MMFRLFVHRCHWTTLLGLLGVIGMGAPRHADAGIMQATMSWASASGSYGGTPFTAQPVTIEFTYDSSTIFPASLAGYSAVNFPNGAGVEITVGSILTNALLDNLASNNSMLIANDTRIFYGYTANGTTYTADRASQQGYDSQPATGALKLTSEWSATSSTASISGGFQAGQYPLTIGGQVLSMNSGSTSGGSITVVPEPSAAVLAGVAGLAAAGFVVRRRCQRSAHPRQPGHVPR